MNRYTGGNKKTGLYEMDLFTILRAADELQDTCTKKTLTAFLRGKSRDANHLKYICPVFGAYSNLPPKEAERLIDLAVQHKFLKYRRSRPIDIVHPRLIYSEKGWKIEREILVHELYTYLSQSTKQKVIYMGWLFRMPTVNNEIIQAIIKKICDNPSDIEPIYLHLWCRHESRERKRQIYSCMRYICKKSI